MNLHRRTKEHAPDRTRLKRRCVWLTVGAALLLAAFVFSSRQGIGVRVGRWEVSLTGATFEIGQTSPSPIDPGEPEPAFVELMHAAYIYPVYAAAWRPFHTSSTEGQSWIFPLWQPLLLVTAMAAHAWGTLRGARYANDPPRCRGCGYSLIGLPEGDEQKCPECGRGIQV